MRNYGEDKDGRMMGDGGSGEGHERGGNYKRFPLYPHPGKSNKIVQNESVTAIDESMWEQIVIRALANPKEWAQLRQALDKIDSDLKAMTALEEGKRNGSGKSSGPKWKFTYHRVTSPLLSLSLNGSRKGDGRLGEGGGFKGKVKAFAAVSIVNSGKVGGESGESIDGKSGRGVGEVEEESIGGDSGNRISTRRSNEKNPWRGRKGEKSRRSWSRTHLEEEIAKMSRDGSDPEEREEEEEWKMENPGRTIFPTSGNEKSRMVTKSPVVVSLEEGTIEWKDILEKYHSMLHADRKIEEQHHHHHHHHHQDLALLESPSRGWAENLVRKTGASGNVRKKSKLQDRSITSRSDKKDHKEEIGGATISGSGSTSSSSKYSAEFHTLDEGEEGELRKRVPYSWNNFFPNVNLDDNEFSGFKSHRRTSLEYKI